MSGTEWKGEMPENPDNKPHPDKDPRTDCYDRIRELVKGTLKEYYDRFPNRIGDARMKDALSYSYFGLELVFTILDEYQIQHSPPSKETVANARPTHDPATP